MINTNLHFTPVLHSPLGESPAGKPLSDSTNAPLKPVEPATATERSRLKAPRQEVDLEQKKTSTGGLPADEERRRAREKRLEREKLEQERAQVTELAARDREVRAHEQAHVAVGGQYAGGARYDYQRGPDGVSYAVSGEVSIDVSKATTPELTIEKAQVVRRAALAPAEPSPQDLRVAAQATRIEGEARKELALERARDLRQDKEADKTEEKNTEENSANTKTDLHSDSGDASASSPPPGTDKEVPGVPGVNSRLAQGIASLNSPKVGGFLDQLA